MANHSGGLRDATACRPAVVGAFAALGLMGSLLLSGCGGSGAGSVDWTDNPKAQAIGAPPPSEHAPPRSQSPRKTTKKAAQTYIPG